MTVVYGAVLIIGSVALIGVLLASERTTPARPVPQVISAAVGFGMAGMSASFAGWAQWMAVGAALVGGIAGAFVPRWVG